MKKDFRIPGFGVSLVLFVLGIYLLGHAGANWIESGSGNMGVGDSEGLFSMKETATIQFIFGICVAVIGFLVFVILSKRRAEIDDGSDF